MVGTLGENELRALLLENWDPLRDDKSLRHDFDPNLLVIARRLHEGGTTVDVRVILAEFRSAKQGRVGRKWGRRDLRVAEKVVRWYETATDETEDRFRRK